MLKMPKDESNMLKGVLKRLKCVLKSKKDAEWSLRDVQTKSYMICRSRCQVLCRDSAILLLWICLWEAWEVTDDGKFCMHIDLKVHMKKWCKNSSFSFIFFYLDFYANEICLSFLVFVWQMLNA